MVFGPYSRQANAPATKEKKVHILIPRTYEYIILHGKRDFADVIKLKDLKWGNYLGISGWVQGNHKGPCKGQAQGSESKKETR